MDTTTTTQPDPTPTHALADLVRRAMQGDVSTLTELRQFLDTHPEVVHEAGNLMVQAERAWTKLAAGPNLIVEESIGRELLVLKDGLGWASATPLERLIIDQVGLAQLEIGFASTRDAQSAGQPLSAGHRDQMQRRTARAHQRLLASVKCLTTVRKLLQRPRSPIEIATKLTQRRPRAVRQRESSMVIGTSVTN